MVKSSRRPEILHADAAGNEPGINNEFEICVPHRFDLRLMAQQVLCDEFEIASNDVVQAHRKEESADSGNGDDVNPFLEEERHHHEEHGRHCEDDERTELAANESAVAQREDKQRTTHPAEKRRSRHPELQINFTE